MSKKVKSHKEKTKRPILKIALKFSILLTFISIGILYSDHKNFFAPDNSNNHSIKKWDAFYEFSRKNDVDILLFGNSHLYTGINPKNLSSSLGVNSFVLASPGTSIIDSYYSIKEAIKVVKPKLIVVETYPINEFDPYNCTDEYLSDQLKSFSARKDFSTKLLSTPFLFSPKNYFDAWSNTLRNHDFLYKNEEQIKKNLKRKPKKKSNKLYLGRYVRFQTGIEDSILSRYENEEPPVNGKNYTPNYYSKHYTSKIIEICRENDIKLIFLTLPMYNKSIANYPIWKKRLSKLLANHSNTDWIDMQDSTEYIGFTPASFENRFSNQHMTYSGSLLATYKLSEYISNHKSIELPNRKNDSEWVNLFYGEEGFFENNLPRSSDTKNVILYNSKNNEIVREILFLKKDNSVTVLAKIFPENEENISQYKSITLRLNVLLKTKDGQFQNALIDLPYDKYHSTNNKINYSTSLQPIEIVKVNNVQFVNS